MKVAVGSQRRRPPLFIGSETQRSKFSNSTVKNRGHFGNSSGSLGNRRRGRRFLLPRFSIPGFRWLGFASKQAPRHQGASVGGFGIWLCICQVIGPFRLNQARFNRPSYETPGENSGYQVSFRFGFVWGFVVLWQITHSRLGLSVLLFGHRGMSDEAPGANLPRLAVAA
jgi:hypothetical protein